MVRKQVAPKRAPSSKADIQAELAEVRAKLAFLVSLKGADFQALVADGEKHAASLEKVRTDSELARLVERINKLAASVQRSLGSVDSGAMAAVLENYAERHPAPAVSGAAPLGLREWIAGAMVSDDSPAK